MTFQPQLDKSSIINRPPSPSLYRVMASESSGVDSASWQEILCGDYSNLPPQDSNVVRVFLSSTFGGEICLTHHS